MQTDRKVLLESPINMYERVLPSINTSRSSEVTALAFKKLSSASIGELSVAHWSTATSQGYLRIRIIKMVGVTVENRMEKMEAVRP